MYPQGGGLMRHNYIVSASPVHFVPDRAWARTNVTGAITSSPHGAVTADSASVRFQFTLANTLSSSASVTVVATLADHDNNVVRVSQNFNLPAGQETTGVMHGKFDNAELWSIARPYLYNVTFQVSGAAASPDSISFTTGIKTVHFDANTGLHMNNQNVKVRGFCDHR